MTTRSGPGEHAAAIGDMARRLAGMLRRMIVTRSTAIWQVAGHLLLDGDVETREAEPFGGVGFTARPSLGDANGDTEALVAFMGEGAANPVIVATRQEGVRRSMAADLADGESQMHNALVLIRIKSDGTVEIRTKAGTAHELALKSDVAALATFVNGLFVGGTGSVVIPPNSVPQPVGTVVLKAE